MRIARILVVITVLVIVAATFISLADAWLWPILGFSNPCTGYPLKGYKPLPGTPGWQNYPDSGRGELVIPGVAFCPLYGYLDFGPVPPSAGRPHGVGLTGNISGPKETTTNKSYIKT